MEEFVIDCVLQPATSASTILRIPVEKASEISTRPLKWLRYATSAVLGAEGILQDILTTQEVDYEAITPVVRHLLYVPSSEIRFIDLHGVDHLMSSQFTTESRVGFQINVANRDHNCVASIFPALLPGSAPYSLFKGERSTS
jgi:hypothetical protein